MASRKHPVGTQEPPRKHTGGTQEAPRKHPGGQRPPGVINVDSSKEGGEKVMGASDFA